MLSVAAAKIDTGDTAWMLVATAMVLLMTPALGLFYAGLVRSKNALNTFMMSLASVAVATVTWAAFGYSFAFGEGNSIIGGFEHAFLSGVGFEPRDGQTIPHLLFFVFQGSFCIITTALISGAVVERMRFTPFLLFAAVWSGLIYPIMAHWAFGGGWLQSGGALDFAGGIPVEMGSGFSALAAAVVVGARRDWGRQALLPHNTVFVLLGAGLLWFGWFGFNGGSGLGTGQASMLAFTNTLLTPACTLLTWFAFDYARGKQVTAIGAATAVIVGCVAITPAGGFIAPGWAMLLGVIATVPSYAVIMWWHRSRIDETLDVLGGHGIAGLTGILFVGFFANESWNGLSDGAGNGLFYGNADLLLWQFIAVLATPAFAFCATFVLLKLIGLVMPLRADDRVQDVGLDVTNHGEQAYTDGEGALLLVTD